MKNYIAIAVCLVWGSGFAHAQNNPSITTSNVPLSQAVNAAWDRSVTAREAVGQVERAAAEKSTAERLWARSPSVEYTQRDNRNQAATNLKETEVGLTWPMWLLGQRRAQNAQAQSALSQAMLQIAVAKLGIAGEVREAAWSFITAETEYKQAISVLDTLTRLADDIERRVHAGDLARADSMIARSERLAALAAQTQALQKLNAVRAHWVNLTGFKQALTLESVIESPSTLQSITEHPKVLLAAQTTDEAKQKLALIQFSNRDTPEVKFGIRQDVSGQNQSGQTSWVIGFKVPIGTSDRYGPLLALAVANVNASDINEQRVQEKVASEFALAKEVLVAAKSQLEAEKERSNLLTERFQLLEKSFKAGETSLPEYLRALSLASQAQSSYLRQMSQTHLATAKFNQSLGVMP